MQNETAETEKNNAASGRDEPVVMRFTGCAHLDYSDNYSAKKQVMGDGKVFWLRDVPSDLPAMVQFCSLRGRLNQPDACQSECKARCGEYLETEHIASVPDA